MRPRQVSLWRGSTSSLFQGQSERHEPLWRILGVPCRGGGGGEGVTMVTMVTYPPPKDCSTQTGSSQISRAHTKESGIISTSTDSPAGSRWHKVRIS